VFAIGGERVLGAGVQRQLAIGLLQQLADGRAQVVVVFDVEDRHGLQAGHCGKSLRLGSRQIGGVGTVLQALALASVRGALWGGDRLVP
jgi:hypothetical protein